MKKIITLLFILLSLNYAYGKDLDLHAQSAVLMDSKTGRILYEKNKDEPLPMASTTKIMTCILALENGNLEDTVTVSQKAANQPKTKMYLSKGEEIKLEYLLYALMMQSANDSAVAISEHISGSVENFCSLMTEKAKELGCKDTVFRTPNGLDDKDHHSTSEDMAIITRYALLNKEFVRIINTPDISFESNKKNYSIVNKNRLLREYEGAMGVKTGFTGKAGHCFVGAAERGDLSLISVVLASGWGSSGKEHKWTDSKKLLNYGFDNFVLKDIVCDYKSETDVKKGKKKSISCHTEGSVCLPVKKDEEIELTYKEDLPLYMEAPIEKNEKVGSVKVYFEDNFLDELPLYADCDVERNTFFTSFNKIIYYFTKGFIYD